MEEFVPQLAMIALVWKVVDFLRFLFAGKEGRSGVVTQATVWVAGVVGVLLFAQTDWASSIQFAGIPLDSMNFWSQFAAGLGLGSLTSVGVDVKKAIDNRDSAAVPPMIKNP